jgi:hypothetical protein
MDGIAIVLISQRKTSTIVVVENVQNVWMTNITDVLRFKTSTIVVVENVQNVWMTNITDVLRFD